MIILLLYDRSRITKEVLSIYQFEKISILLRRSLVLWLIDILKKYLHGRQKN